VAKPKTPKNPKGKTASPMEVVITFDLFELPSAFHKAGLAGLVLLIESLRARHLLKDDEPNYELKPTSLTIAFTKPMVQVLMDDMYAAKVVEVAVKSKWQGATVKREDTIDEEKDGNKVTSKRFIYDVVQPVGQFLRDHFPEMDPQKDWHKLWRDMLWTIPRGRPTTREPFNQCAKKEPCKEGADTWEDLLKVGNARTKNSFYTTDLSSALYPGAQAVNAEGVPFKGRAEQNLLLHFWSLTVLLFVPQRVDTDGSTEFAGFTLAVPEVGNLTEFTRDYPSLLARLNDGLKPNQLARGFRPTRAVIDLPAESALAFLSHLAELSSQNVEKGELRHSIRSVEYLHLVKEGNNVKAMASGRVSPNSKLLEGYRSIVEPKDEAARFRNPLFRRGLLIALLNDELNENAWHRPFSKTLATFNVELFVHPMRRPIDSQEEKGMPLFANDAGNKFRQESQKHESKIERMKSMADHEGSPRCQTPLPVILNRVVRNYLLTRASDKSGINLKDYKVGDDDIDWKKIPPKFKMQAFVDHFAATFFSVTQRLSEVDRLELASMLINSDRPDRYDDLKTLTLLALSANS
jgi:CRISPR-associated protein Cmx8